MKKIFALLLIVTMVLIMTACGNKAEDNSKAAETTTAAVTEVAKEAEAKETDDGRTPATEYTFTAKADSEQVIENLLFSEDVTVDGTAGLVIFQNCKFEKNIINKGTSAVIARFMPGNEFSGSTQAIISSGIKDATIETDLPKMMFFCEPIEVKIEDAGAVVTFADSPVKMNGSTYVIADSDMFLDEEKGEFGEYSGQEANMHNVCTWIEGGENKVMQVAIYVAME